MSRRLPFCLALALILPAAPLAITESGEGPLESIDGPFLVTKQAVLRLDVIDSEDPAHYDVFLFKSEADALAFIEKLTR